MTIDSISRDVFQHEVVSVAEEMSAALCKSAYSPIIWDMIDYACGVLDPSGNTISQAATIPAQLGIMPTAFRFMLKDIPLAAWREGDVIISNDPYFGCTHTPDIVLFSPAFHEGRLIAVTSTVAHHIDVGGKVPGSEAPDAREIFEEGLRFPPLKLFDEGRRNEAIYRIFARNCRDPKASIGDLNAQVAACRTGERRLADLARKYGIARMRALMGSCLDYAESYARAMLQGVEGQRGAAEVLIEDDAAMPEPMKLAVSVSIGNGRLAIDFTGTSAQRANGLNCPLSSTIGMTHYAVKCLLTPDLPQNEGCNRPLDITIPEGTILNPTYPAAVSARHPTQQAVADVVLKALAPLMPQAAAAGCQIAFPTFTVGGFDRRPGAIARHGAPPYFVIADILGGGMGASPAGSGMDGVDTHGSNCGLCSAEVMETTSPVRVLETRLVPGSGGPGRHPGGLAIERSYEMLSDGLVLTGYIQQTRPETAPWGAQGGGPGGLARIELTRGGKTETPPTKIVGYAFDAGDRIRLTASGGGGWGPPGEVGTP